MIYINKILRKERTKLAIFDVDWTLIKPKNERRFPLNKEDWQWFRDSVPAIMRKYHRNGYRIVFVTDQTKEWKVDMIKDVINTLNIPVTAIIAMNKEEHKPNPSLFNSYFVEFDREASFYVGDAAGREGDWAAKDKEFAENIKIKFYTPEEIFPVQQKRIPVKKTKEIIVMVGYPGAGKTTFANQFKDYINIDGDTYKTPEKMVAEAEKHIENKSIIFDATNGTKEKRQIYYDFANKYNLPVRCIWVKRTLEEAMKQNKERETPVPDVALYVYRKKFEEPTKEECKNLVIV